MLQNVYICDQILAFNDEQNSYVLKLSEIFNVIELAISSADICGYKTFEKSRRN